MTTGEIGGGLFRSIGIAGLGRVGAALRDVLGSDLASTMGLDVIGVDRDDDLHLLGRCDLVVEAVTEDLATKRAVIDAVHAIAPQAIVLSTTSSLTVRELVGGQASDLRLGVWHPFTPLLRRPLVEVVDDEHVDHSAVAAARWLTAVVGHAALDVRDSTGFVANRILKRWTHAGLLAVEQGADARTLDAAWLDLGFRMGPIGVVALVGPSTSWAVSLRFAEAFGTRFEPPRLLREAAADSDVLTALLKDPGPTSAKSALLPEVLASARAEVRDECERVLEDGTCLTGRAGIREALLVGLGWPAQIVNGWLP